MDDPFAAKLAELDFRLPPGNQLPTAAEIEAFEVARELQLPADYRRFLLAHGGASGIAKCSFLELTPLGTEICIAEFVNFDEAPYGGPIELINEVPATVIIGWMPFFKLFCIRCAEPYYGHIFVRDGYQYARLPDEEFQKWPKFAAELAPYLDARRAGQLPVKPPGFEDLHLVARSFTEFIARLQRYEFEPGNGIDSPRQAR